MIAKTLTLSILILAGGGLASCSEESATAQETAAAEHVVAAEKLISVYKTPTCGCCNAWIDHLEQAGFEVDANDVPSTNPVASEAGVPSTLRSCHTAKIGGYVIEGHVPAADIKRLLDERPDIVGLTVPGMPVGSPGMEMGDRKDSYNVLAIGRDGSTSVFASY